MPITDLQTMRRALSGLGGFLIFRLGASQAAAMGVLGLILAMVGVYGVVSYGAAQRTREIGIRMAMGAQPIDILRLVLRQGVTLVAVGVMAGLVLTLSLARVLEASGADGQRHRSARIHWRDAVVDGGRPGRVLYPCSAGDAHRSHERPPT